MKLSLFIPTALLASTAYAAVLRREETSTELESREFWGTLCLEGEKYLGGYDPGCSGLAHDCIYNKANGTEYLWSKTSCIAAATCAGTQNIYIVANCTNPLIPDDPAQLPPMSYNVYASIVGSCAWQEGGCPITFQNYVDFYYAALSAIKSSSWPSSPDDIKPYWDKITAWTKTGDTIPYLNFNDWLHYSEGKIDVE